MPKKLNLLVTQSFIMGDKDSYWDYRDYVFALCSNLSIKDAVFRLNVERGVEWINELKLAAEFYKFSDIQISADKPTSWAGYMLEQIEENPKLWTMPFPGDHIYINPNDNAYVNALKKGEELKADVVAYSHVQDFDRLIDWNRVKVLYNDKDYVMIEWGNKYKYFQNPVVKKDTKKKLGIFLTLVPVLGFATYKTELFREILKALPPNSRRWQDMEYSSAKSAWRYKLLIPKKCLYRHVHGYWLECYLKYKNSENSFKDIQAEIQFLYIRSEYNWRNNSLNRLAYKKMCLQKYPYFERYFDNRIKNNFFNGFAKTPFDAGWHQNKSLILKIDNFLKNFFIDNLKRNISYIIRKMKK